MAINTLPPSLLSMLSAVWTINVPPLIPCFCCCSPLCPHPHWLLFSLRPRSASSSVSASVGPPLQRGVCWFSSLRCSPPLLRMNPRPPFAASSVHSSRVVARFCFPALLLLSASRLSCPYFCLVAIRKDTPVSFQRNRLSIDIDRQLQVLLLLFAVLCFEF